MDPASFVVAEQVVSTTLEGAAVASVGVAQKTHPLSAAFTQFASSNFLPRFDHTISVCNGRAFIFGGQISEQEVAGNEIHIVKLPIDQANAQDAPEYQIVPALSEGGGEASEGDVPKPRSGQAAEVIGDKIYVYGGRGNDGKPLEETGRVWCFNTAALRWTSIDPVDSASCPPARYAHSVASSKKPVPQPETGSGTIKDSIQAAVKKLPELVSKAEPMKAPHGTLIVVSGLDDNEKLLEDAWAFDVATAKWTPLPAFPSSLNSIPALSLVERQIYVINHPSNLEGEVFSFKLPITDMNEDAPQEKMEVAASIPEWQRSSFPTNALVPGPEARSGAGLLPITTGHGRIYLLYFFGEELKVPISSEEPKPSSSDNPGYLSTLYTYQPSALPSTAASTKDATRSVISVDSGEHSWAEVRVIPREEVGNDNEGKAHPGPRSKFAYAGLGLENKGGGWVSAGIGKMMGRTEEDTESGYGVLMWGGKDAKGEVTGDGWILRVR